MNWTDYIDQIEWEVKKGEGEYKECPDKVVVEVEDEGETVEYVAVFERV